MANKKVSKEWTLRLLAQVPNLAPLSFMGNNSELLAEVCYDLLEKSGFIPFGPLEGGVGPNPEDEGDQLWLRLCFNGAEVWKDTVICPFHEVDLIKEEGVCLYCEEAMDLIGQDMAEERAMREADRIMENDDYFTPDYTGREYEEEA